MIWLLIVAATAVGVVLVTLGVTRGRCWLPDLPPAVSSTPGPLPLPARTGAITRADLEAIRLDRAPRGYDVTEVDLRLDAIADLIDPTPADQGSGTDPNRTPNAAAPIEHPDRESLLRALAGEPISERFLGYRMDQVDAVLDRWSRPDPSPAPELAFDRPDGDQPDGDQPDGDSGVAYEVPVPDRLLTPQVIAPIDQRDADTDPARTPAAMSQDTPGQPTTGIVSLRQRPATGIAPALYAVGAAYVLGRLIADPAGGYLSQGVQDQQAFEWYFGATAHNLATLANPLFTQLQNYPDGVNLMSNAAVMGLGIPLAPLTWAAGPHVTFVLIEWLGYTLTAWAWYALFVRRLHASSWTAMVGGALAGFSPAMLSHGNGHPNFLAQFLIPVIIDRLVALQEAPDRWRRNGLILGLLAVWQLWLGEEVLLLGAVGIGLLGLVLAAHARLRWRGLVAGAAVAIGVGLVLFAFPLWWQFFGPQSYREIWSPPGGNDLAALWGRASRSIGADPWAAAALSMNRTEENAFFGIPLWCVAAAAVVILWRRPLARALAVVIVVTCWLSLGPEVLLHGQPTSIPALWAPFDNAPLIGNVLASRFSMVAVPAFAALLVLLLEEGRGRRHQAPFALPVVAAGAAVAFALLPMVPTPLIVDARPTVPALFTGGSWADYVDGGSVLAAPPPDIIDMRAADWQAATGYDFPLIEGYFLGPDATGSGMGQRGATRRSLSQWLARIVESGQPLTATQDDRVQFRQDLQFWRADAIVLPQGRDHEEPLLTSLTSAFGSPIQREGVWLWDVRSL